MTPPDDRLDQALAGLPRATQAAERAAETHRRARRVLRREAALKDRPLARAWDRHWVRKIEPVLLAGASGYYFLWVMAVLWGAAR